MIPPNVEVDYVIELLNKSGKVQAIYHSGNTTSFVVIKKQKYIGQAAVWLCVAR